MARLLPHVLGLYFLTEHVFSSNDTCTNQTYCHNTVGPVAYCDVDSGTCQCGGYFENSSCIQCPGIGESCESSQCCNNNYLACYDNVCTCFINEYCWLVAGMNEEDRERLQRVAQGILATALLLTATILFILFWNSCARRRRIAQRLGRGERAWSPFAHRMNSSRFQSLNSIQRLVLMHLQDRPPPYNPDLMSPSKKLFDKTDPPPSYLEAMGYAFLPPGEGNPIFVIGGNTEDMTRSSASEAVVRVVPVVPEPPVGDTTVIQAAQQDLSSASLELHV